MPNIANFFSPRIFELMKEIEIEKDQETLAQLFPELNRELNRNDYELRAGKKSLPKLNFFDENYVYDRATELNWNDPTSFKRFNVGLPMTARCVRSTPDHQSGGHATPQ